MKFVKSAGILVPAVTLSALPAFAQSCSLCYTQAASSSQRFIEALRSGILILIIPPMLGTLVVGYVAYRRRNDFCDTEASAEQGGWE
jgi:hypothetical protein